MRVYILTLVASFLVSQSSFAQLKFVSMVEDPAKNIKLISTCRNFFIKKSGSTWAVTDTKNLKDENVEKLQGCLGYVNQPPINAVVFSVETDGICSYTNRCMPKTISGNSRCVDVPWYHKETSRDNGYYSCNSNFAKRRVFGGMDEKEPINKELLLIALESESLRAAANEFAQSEYERVLQSSLQDPYENCDTKCFLRHNDIEKLFKYYAELTKSDDLVNAALNHTLESGNRRVPEWMSGHLSATEVASIQARGEQFWRDKYRTKINALLSNQSTSKTVSNFVNFLQNAKPENWQSVDFDNRLAELKELLQHRLDQERNEVQRIAREEEDKAALRRQKEDAQVLQWRKTLQVGSDTFCGPVIEVRPPMVKIAVSVQLQGYSNEAWLKASEVYPQQYGCRNVNGRLRPY